MKQIDRTGMHKQEVVRNHTVNTEMIKIVLILPTKMNIEITDQPTSKKQIKAVISKTNKIKVKFLTDMLCTCSSWVYNHNVDKNTYFMSNQIKYLFVDIFYLKYWRDILISFSQDTKYWYVDKPYWWNDIHFPRWPLHSCNVKQMMD